ncbi:uncharacterized protein LOC123522859 [Mercenaria mercenaria]|uniref:uncharacterized protein LOC123522859 n=1 Tax=Mercenaria mercenaria TaxID=6596 RepID=UPI00234F6E1E|nr:uncharacterized protein LOC123522859 [Mercenaria mercenaria]
MSHQLHLEKEKYRQWVKAGLGLGYLKEGLAPFCDDVAKQQHKDILDNIKQTKNLSAVTCGQCNLRTLKPDHVKIGKNQCPLGQANCNCCYTSSKIACPNNVCGAIYDTIITNHASTPPAPYWKNTQTQQWTGDPWSIAKCFINAPGYDRTTSAADINCTGLLHVIINNKYFHNHIQNNLAGANVFSKVRQYRNEIFHSSSMELEEADANTYIDDMIAVLQDGKELIHRKDAQDAVKKLEELKNEGFIVTTENMQKMHGDVGKEFGNLRISTERLATKDDRDDLKKKLSALESLLSEQAEEMKRLKTDDSAQKKQPEYEKSKLDLQRRLIEFYREDLLRMSALPFQQEGNLCDFKDIYVRPRMTIESKDKLDNKPKVADVLSMSDIFTKDGKPIKIIYVLGDAGSGKSSFCKSLINYWCLAHSEQGQSIDDEFSGVKEMKKFNFLFYLPLRHHTDKMKIKEMLEEKYEHPALMKLLKYESRTCLVVLDGLDEWNPPASKCTPERGALKEYTVLTTSRPWKIATLGITDYEIRQKIILKRFDDDDGGDERNKTFKKDKYPANLIPAEIMRMDKESIDLYKQLLNEGKEAVYNIRVMVVGPFGVGKTTLTKRLLREDVDLNLQDSTNGIDVHVRRCKVSLSNGRWNILEKGKTSDDTAARLAKLLNKQVDDQKTIEKKETKMPNGVVSTDSDSVETERKNLLEEQEETLVEDSVPIVFPIEERSDSETNLTVGSNDQAIQTVGSKDQAIQNELEDLMKEVPLDATDTNSADLSIWDFAGQYVFYSTHRVFLSERAIYLLVTDISKDINEIVKDDSCVVDCNDKKQWTVSEFVHFWLNSIHEFCSFQDDKGPPVLLVGTFTDQLDQKTKGNIVRKYFHELRASVLGKGTFCHIEGNEDFDMDNSIIDDKIERLRHTIFDIASKQSYWGEHIPAKWITLERKIVSEKDLGKKVLYKKQLRDLNGELLVSIETDEELELFLRFHHESGNILYFSEAQLSDSIVLDPQWLIDAFKSIITEKTFYKKNETIFKNWLEFEKSAKLTDVFVDMVWEKSEFYEHKDLLLRYLQKLGFIVKPRQQSNSAKVM